MKQPRYLTEPEHYSTRHTSYSNQVQSVTSCQALYKLVNKLFGVKLTCTEVEQISYDLAQQQTVVHAPPAPSIFP